MFNLIDNFEKIRKDYETNDENEFVFKNLEKPKEKDYQLESNFIYYKIIFTFAVFYRN